MSAAPKKRRVETSSDPNVWMKWLAEEVEDDTSDTVDPEESDSNEEDHVTESEHDTESEQSADEVETCEGELQNSYYVGKDKITKWSKSCPKKSVRTRSENIIIHLPGPKKHASKIVSEDKLLDLFLDSNVYKIIVSCTNIFINHLKSNFQRERDARCTDETEIRALFGLLYLIGTLRSSRKNASLLWDNSKGNGLESCYLTMSEKRFRFLLRCLRFDDIRDRETRKVIDKLAPVREIFETIVHNFSAHFIPSEYVTVDEQLLSFRGRCQFRQYLPNKPSKYGIKTFALVCAKTAYTCNLETYAGNQPHGPYKQSNSPTDVVMRLVEPVSGTHRNITGDNWFSSIPLAKNLLADRGLTYVGTLRKNKREIPREFLANKERKQHSSLFGFQHDCTLVSYCPKANKSVLLISTLHHSDSIDEETGTSMKPEIVTFYNTTKVGVDLLDQLIQKNDVSRNTRRWPMVVFYNLLNISAMNALCIHRANSKECKSLRRTEFLQRLSWEMIKPQIQYRSALPQVPIELRRRACVLLGVTSTRKPSENPKQGSRGRCRECGRKKDRTTRRWCQKCKEWMCGDHLHDVCFNCL